MLAKKRKSDALEGIQELYDSITDLLIEIKPKLSGDKRDESARSALLVLLRRLANLAESFTEQRPRSNKQWLTLADNLDREGVNLWNTSGILRQRKDQEDLKLFAILRLAAFRLVEAGLEHKPGIETLLHVLQLASKTGSALSEIGTHDVAGAVLGTAAKFEEALKNAPGDTHGPAKARALIVYYSCRMEAAWKEGNECVAQFMLHKITEDNQCLTHLSQHDREQLASKILEIGKSVVKNPNSAESQSSAKAHDGKKAQEAIKWIQKAFALVENTSEETTSASEELKRAILRSLARVYYLASSVDEENLSRAEATLHELLTSINDKSQAESTEFQQVRWMRLAVLKRKRAADSLLLEAFRSIVDHSDLNETELSDVLQELRGMTLHHVLVTQVTHHLLETTLASGSNTGHLVDRILLALIFHSSRDQDHDRAIKAIDTACDRIAENTDYELPKIPTTACQSLLWQFGDRHYNAKTWSKAADWFLLGAHQAFKSMARTNQARCFRKAALCYVQQKEYASATATVRRCRGDEASTHYVTFLTAVHQGLEDEAIRSIQAMLQATDFNRKMLLLATQLAHEANLKVLLLTVLDALLEHLRSQGGTENEVEILTMVRCIIRLVMELIKRPAAELNKLIPALIRHLETAKAVVDSALNNANAALVTKDLSWLWRTAYNMAIQGCAEWDDAEEKISQLFDLSRQFMEAYCKFSVTDIDATVPLHMVYAHFSSISGRVFAVRRSAEDSDQTEARRRICSDIREFKARVSAMRSKGQVHTSSVENDRICSLMHVMHIFEIELLCVLQDWDSVLVAIEEASQSKNVNTPTFEALADILWVETSCPINVLYAALEAILRACLNQNCISVEKFSRWLRAICTILLAHNTPTDRSKAIGYVEQAVCVIEENSDDESTNVYPVDERQWLLSTTYNTGVECLSASHLDEAKRWFESATVISRYVPDSKERAQKISETYSRLLARYGTRTAST